MNKVSSTVDCIGATPVDKLKIESYLPLRANWVNRIKRGYFSYNTIKDNYLNQFRKRMVFGQGTPNYYKYNFCLEFEPLTKFYYVRGKGVSSLPLFRLWLNPNRNNMNINELIGLLKDLFEINDEKDLAKLFIRRIDLKLDIMDETEKWALSVLVDRKRKSVVYTEDNDEGDLFSNKSGELETLYIGSKNNQCVIYNKAKERKIRRSLTRLEYRSTYGIKELNIINFLKGNFKMFDNVKVYDINKLDEKRKGDRELLYGLTKYSSLHEAMGEVEQTRRYRLKQNLYNKEATTSLHQIATSIICNYLAIFNFSKSITTSNTIHQIIKNKKENNMGAGAPYNLNNLAHLFDFFTINNRLMFNTT